MTYHSSVEAAKFLEVDLAGCLLKAGDWALGKEEAKHACNTGADQCDLGSN